MRRRGPGPAAAAVARTELVWPGKYDERGAVRQPVREPAPLRTLERFEHGAAAQPGWRNLLVHGDNLLAMASLLERFAGKLDLVYIDPPFATGSEFRAMADVGEGGEVPNAIARSAYDDDWGRERGGWYSMLYDRLVLIRELLSERGTLYLHLDWAAGHHARVILDEVFGAENSLGEIVWSYGSASGGRARGRKLVKAHDLIFVFARRYGRHRFRPVYLPYSEKYVRDWFKYADEDGRRFRKRWRRDAEGRSYVEKQYLDQSRGVPCSTVWTDIQQVYADPRAYRQGMSSEVTGFPTQKPLRLLERILEISSEPGDLVADFFCGSGTTLEAAQRLGRRWIGCDAGRLAIQTARRRLIGLEPPQPFDLVDFGPAERARALRGMGTAAVRGLPLFEPRQGARRNASLERRHVGRVLEAYGAQALEDAGRWLHGRCGGAAVHVASFDRPLTSAEVEGAREASVRAGYEALHVLAWEIDPELDPAVAAGEGRGVLVLRIPREVLSGRGDSAFREVPRLGVSVREGPDGVLVALEGFELTRPERLDPAVSRTIGGWSDFVEHWAVDWDFDGAFRPGWWAFRTRRDRRLPLESAPCALESGPRRIAVQVLDIFGETTLRVLDAARQPARAVAGR
jgi:adenine-specific DNA-methyltransferase